MSSRGGPWGLVLEYPPASSGTGPSLTGCAFTPGLPVSDTGAIDDSGGMTLKVTMSDGALDSARDGDGKVTISGTFHAGR